MVSVVSEAICDFLARFRDHQEIQRRDHFSRIHGLLNRFKTDRPHLQAIEEDHKLHHAPDLNVFRILRLGPLRKTFGTMLTLAGVPQRVVMELMRHSDMRLTAKTYTDAGMLPTDATVTKLPSLNGAVTPAPQLAPQSLVQARPALSLVVRETEVPHFAGTRMDTRFERNLALPVNECPAMSESEEWCAMQGSNLRANAAFIRVCGRLTHK